MEIVFHLSVLIISLCVLASGQNVPNDPLWSIFVQALSAQTGRTVQDINTLGLSDPSINILWTGYKANMPSYVTSPPTTTPPPLPDLYQTSYSFSSNSPSQPQTSQTQPSTNDIYSSLINIINQASPSSPATSGTQAAQSTSTSMQDILKAYSQFSAPGTAQTDLLAATKVGTGSTGGTADVTSLMQQYAAIMGQSPGTAAAAGSTGGTTADISQLLQQYSSGTGANTPNYSQLLQQYNQIMSAVTPAPATSVQMGTSGQLTAEQLMAMYSQFSASSSPASPSPNTPSATSTPAPPTPTTFEQQLADFFPQFKNMFPSTANATGNASTDATQMIFDTLLFGPTSGTGVPAAEQSTQAPVPNPVMNLITPPEGQGASLISNHVENVFKTKASRELGCRFLPELLELDLLATAPIDCIGKCPFPYINSQKFGVYCVCCPPGVNEQLAGAMSLFRRASYLETPLAVTT